MTTKNLDAKVPLASKPRGRIHVVADSDYTLCGLRISETGEELRHVATIGKKKITDFTYADTCATCRTETFGPRAWW